MVASRLTDTLETCVLMFVQVINMAEEGIWITSSYFVPTLLNYGTGFVEVVADMLEEDFHHNRLVKLEGYTKRSFIFRLAMRSARLPTPIL